MRGNIVIILFLYIQYFLLEYIYSNFLLELHFCDLCKNILLYLVINYLFDFFLRFVYLNHKKYLINLYNSLLHYFFVNKYNYPRLGKEILYHFQNLLIKNILTLLYNFFE